MRKNKIIYSIIFLCIGMLLVLEKTVIDSPFSIDRFFILSCVIVFIGLHFLIKTKDIYDFMYKYRYYIGGLLLLYITVRGLHGSSIGIWNQFLQPHFVSNGSNPILGIARGIRSDEWMVSTPHMLSQYNIEFSKINTLMMGSGGLVTLYPSLPCLSIAIIGKLFYLPYLILPSSNAFALYWFGKLFVLFFATFELFMILTNKKKLYAMLGAILIAFAPTNMWWYSIDMMLWGNLALVLIYYFIRESKNSKRLLYSVLIGIVGLNYIMLVYPAWQISFGYIYAILIIWILIINKKFLNKKQLLYIPIIIGVILAVLIPTIMESKEIFNLINNTVYPGKRFITGGYHWELLFTYLMTPLYSFYNVVNPSEYSNYIGLYPIPLIIAVYQIIKGKIKNKKMDMFLILFSITIIFISLWNFISLPSWFVKASLLSFSTPDRSQIVVGYACIFLLTYLMTNYESTKKVSKKALIISVLISTLVYVLGIFAVNKIIKDYVTTKVIIAMAIVFIPILTMLIINNKKYNKYLAISLIILALLTGAVVNPITRGLGAIYDKPIAKEIRKIVKKEPNAIWGTINTNFITSNYALANGAKIINSVNYYPNFKLWNKLDPDKEYEGIYNRYAHVSFELTEEETNFVLAQQDRFIVNLNIKDICKLSVKYFISDLELKKYNSNEYVFDTIYNEDGIIINTLNCK